MTIPLLVLTTLLVTISGTRSSLSTIAVCSVIMLFPVFKYPGDICPLSSTQPLKLPGVLAAIPCPGVTRLVS